MRNNFQSLLLVILVLVSLAITKGIKFESSAVAQPASFTDSVAASSLASGESPVVRSDSPAGQVSAGAVIEQIPPVAASSSLPEILSKTEIALVSDMDSGADFINYNSGERWPLASITKLMTAVLAIEQIGKEKEIAASTSSLAVEGNLGKLDSGKLYKVEDVLKIMVITSSNHAAEALADSYPAGRDVFIESMNKKAASLGMNQTVFYDPTGLSPLNQSTANDIKKLISYIINNHPEILAYSREKNFGNFQNINIFAGRPDFLGGKTGYIDESKQNLASLFSVNSINGQIYNGANGRRILIIVLGADDRFDETQKLLNFLTNEQ